MLISPEIPVKTDGRPAHPIWNLSLSVLTCWLLTGLVFGIGFCSSWTEHWEGFLVGLFHWALIALVVLPAMLVLSGGLFYFTRRKQHQGRILRIVAIGIPLFLFCMTVGSVVISPPTAKSRLARLLTCKLPSSLKIEKSFFEGGGISDMREEYFVTGAPLDLEALKFCGQFEMAEADPQSNAYNAFAGLRSGFPKPLSWSSFSVFVDDRNSGPVFMILSGDRTKAVIVHYTF